MRKERIRFGLATGLACLVLTGCVSVSELPEPESIAAPERLDKVPPDGEPIREDWWQSFGDGNLDALIEAAEERAPTLEAALLNIERARATARLEGSSLSPQLNSQVSATRSRQSGSTGNSVSPGTTRNRFFAALQLDWEIDPWGRVRKLRTAREQEVVAASQAYGYALVLLRSQVAQTYFAIRALDRRIGILEATIKVREDALGLVKIRLESGLSDELEVAQATTEYASAKADLERARGTRETLENALATLSGQYAGRFEVTPDRDYALPEVAVPRVVESETLLRRPDVLEALQLLEAASSVIGARVAEYYPSVSLSGEFGYAASEASNWFDEPSQLWSLGPSLDLPIFQGRERQMRLELAEIEYRSLFNAYFAQVLRAFEEVESSLSTLQQLEREQVALKEASEAATKAASLARQRYESGLVSYLEVVDTERAALSATLRLSLVEMERYQRLAQLYAELGGGWHLEEQGPDDAEN